MKLLLLFGFLAVCYAQLPLPCDSPKQWEGELLLSDRSKHFSERARVHYDEENMRTKTEDMVEQGREKELFEVLTLYKTKKEYRVSFKTKKCNVTTIDYPFRPIGVPKDAKFMFEAEVGLASAPNEHLTVTTFYGNYTEDHVRYSTTVTYPSCIPIADNYYNDVTGYVENRYINIRPGINNTAVFDIPKACTSEE